jgi:predicted nucleic acid-binding protein
MRSPHFVDTWFLIAMLDRFDSGHPRAVRLNEQLTAAAAPLVTHDAIFVEALTYFSASGARARQAASRAVRSSYANLTVFPADRVLFLSGLALYEARPDKEYSLVDCMSMQLMRDRGIAHVLTNDHHFRQEGFQVVNDAP